MEKDCRRKLGLCLRCGKGDTLREIVVCREVRRIDGGEEEEKQEQGFVEDL